MYHISFHIISYHIISYHIISYHIISYHITSLHFISHHVMSCHVMSCHVMSCHIISYHITLYPAYHYNVLGGYNTVKLQLQTISFSVATCVQPHMVKQNISRNIPDTSYGS